MSVNMQDSDDDQNRSRSNSLSSQGGKGRTIQQHTSRPQPSTPPAPPATLAENFVPPQENTLAWNQIRRINENPHSLLPAFDPESPEDTADLANFQANSGNWERAVIPISRLFENVDEAQRSTVLQSPEKYMALVVFLGGGKLFSTFPKLRDTLMEKFSPLVEGRGSLDIIHTKAARKLSQSVDKYAPPFILLARVDGARLRRILTSHQTFAIDKTLAVHALPIDSSIQSWSVGIFKTTIPGTPDTIKSTIRTAIMTTLLKDSQYRILIERATGRQNEKPREQRIFEATASLSTRFIAQIDGKAKSTAWLIMLAPCTRNDTICDDIKARIRALTYYHEVYPIELHPISAKKNFYPGCIVCKLDTHLSFDCQFAKEDRDFWGPTEQLSSTIKETGSSRTNRRERNTGKGRDKGPRGPRR